MAHEEKMIMENVNIASPIGRSIGLNFFCNACKVPLPVSLQDNVEDDRNTHDGGNGIEGNDR